MTFWFDTAHNAWTVEENDDPVPPPQTRAGFLIALILFAGVFAATTALRVLG